MNLFVLNFINLSMIREKLQIELHYLMQTIMHFVSIIKCSNDCFAVTKQMYFLCFNDWKLNFDFHLKFSFCLKLTLMKMDHFHYYFIMMIIIDLLFKGLFWYFEIWEQEHAYNQLTKYFHLENLYHSKIEEQLLIIIMN